MHHVHDLIMFYAAELEPEHGELVAAVNAQPASIS